MQQCKHMNSKPESSLDCTVMAENTDSNNGHWIIISRILLTNFHFCFMNEIQPFLDYIQPYCYHNSLNHINMHKWEKKSINWKRMCWVALMYQIERKRNWCYNITPYIFNFINITLNLILVLNKCTSNFTSSHSLKFQ